MVAQQTKAVCYQRLAAESPIYRELKANERSAPSRVMYGVDINPLAIFTRLAIANVRGGGIVGAPGPRRATSGLDVG